MPNRLSRELSPYLLQHADNPVEWHPWGPEAWELARSQEKPVFLSIGYAACHWCHVMAHESFEDPQIARLLNEGFVSIKVDREERPDLDQIYMEVVQAMTGRGGWPMSVFLTPAQEPLFAGTYWPPHRRGGMPGFGEILRGVGDAWNNRRAEALAQARRITQYLQEHQSLGADGQGVELSVRPLDTLEEQLGAAFDPQFGGFGPAPKFPPPVNLRLLLRRWRRSPNDRMLDMVTTTLDHMTAGGIYDHLGGGFHRYSVDARWLVPHFEKMLYDNALLAVCYLEAWQATGRAAYARTVRETLDYVLRDMRDPAGGFYSSEDADSEGEEGRFYLWTPQEVEAVLGHEAAATFCTVYDVSDAGNFEGRNILNLSRPIEVYARMFQRPVENLEAELAEGRSRLLAARSRRVRPGRDDKVLVSWNGLMIDALTSAGAALGEPRYVEAAAAAAEFLCANLRTGRGLLHCWRGGEAKGGAFLDDYAGMASALVTLYEARPEERWLDAAAGLADDILARFADPERGGFFFTPDDHEPLILRKKDIHDSPVPSGNGLAATLLLRLGRLRHRDDYRAAAERTLRGLFEPMCEYPTATGQLLLALDECLHPNE